MKKLNGLSGVDVLLLERESDLKIVRKIAKNENQNGRLFKHYKKHLFFSQIEKTSYKVPGIIESGYKDGLFYYEYKYIKGNTFFEVLKNVSAENLTSLKTILDKILNIIEELGKNRNPVGFVDTKDSFSKALKRKIRKNSTLCNISSDIMNKLIDKADELNSYKSTTLNHGDFTFDNIVIDENNNIWLIDFTDLFYSHYWLDISKMFQDTEGSFYKIKHGVNVSNDVINYIDIYLKNAIKKIDPDYIYYHKLLMAVTYLRLLPYVIKKVDKRRVFDNIVNVVSCFT